MAIQHRRGVFNQFDPTKLLPGEWAVVLSGDTSTEDGKAVYACFAAGDVKRMATFEDMVENIASADAAIVAQLTQGAAQVEAAIEAAEALRVSAETARETAETARETAETARGTAETARATAETGRVTAETARSTAETQRVTRFAEMEQLAHGWIIHHCTSSEYDSTTRKPTVSSPDSGTLYCVPNTGVSGDAWTEWRYDTESQDFEPVGSATANTSPITTSTIDSIVGDTAETGTEVLQTTGLTYLWTKLKAAFAALTHYHTGLGDSSNTIVSANLTKRSVAEGYGSTASGYHSHAEGRQNTASGDQSHAEGYYSTASNDQAHAEGYNTTASGARSHAEGYATEATASYAHAEGYFSKASASSAHAEGESTRAASQAQHVQGKYNVVDSNGTYAHIIGGGADGARANIHTVDWNGNAFFGKSDTNGSPYTYGTVNGVNVRNLLPKSGGTLTGNLATDSNTVTDRWNERLVLNSTYTITDTPIGGAAIEVSYEAWIEGMAQDNDVMMSTFVEGVASSDGTLSYDGDDTFTFVAVPTGYSYVRDMKIKYVTAAYYIKAAGEVSAHDPLGTEHKLTEKADASGYTWGQAKDRFTWGSIRGSAATSDSSTTTNLGLTKPGYGSTLDIATLNTDLDTIDSVIGDTVLATDGSLQSQLDSLRSSVGQLIKTDSFTQSYTVNANDISPAVNVTCSKAGYSLIGVIGYSTGNGSVCIQAIKKTSGTNVECYFRNVSGSQVSATAELYCLFVKNL